MPRSIRFALTVLTLVLPFRTVEAQDQATGIDESPSGEQPYAISFQHFDTASGLSDHEGTALLQDSRGHIWIGTRDGLNRYDGYTFRVFRSDPSDPEGLASSDIEWLQEDAKGRIWVLAAGTISVYDPAIDRVRRLPIGFKWPSFDAPSTVSDIRGQVWVSNETGVFEYAGGDSVRVIYSNAAEVDSLDFFGSGRLYETPDGAVWRTVSTRIDPRIADGLFQRMDPDSEVFQTVESGYQLRIIGQDVAGNLWISTESRITRLDALSGERQEFSPIEPPVALTQLKTPVPDASGRYWFPAGAAGVYQLDPETGAWRHVPISGYVSEMTPDPSGYFWVTIRREGIGLLDPISGKLSRFRSEAGDEESLASDGVNDLMIDRENAVWLATHEGLDRISRSGLATYRIPLDPAKPWSSQTARIRRAFQDSRGLVWLGAGDELYRFDPDLGSLRLDKMPGVSQPGGFAIIEEDPGGRIWLGGGFTAPQILGRFDPTSGVYRRWDGGGGFFGIQSIRFSADGDVFAAGSGLRGLWRVSMNTGDFSVVASFARSGAEATYADRHLVRARGQIYVDQRGLYRYSRTNLRMEEIVLTSIPAEARAKTASDAWTLADHEIWQLWPGWGLGRYNVDTGRDTLFLADVADPTALSSSDVNSLFEDNAGTIWMGTDNGLDRFDRKSQSFRRFSVQTHGLESNQVEVLGQSGVGQIWLRSPAGLTLFDPRSESVRNIHAVSQVREQEQRVRPAGGGNAATVLKNGSVLVEIPGGIAVIDPSGLGETVPPAVSINEVRILNEGSGAAITRLHPGPDGQIDLPFGQRDFAVHYVGLHFERPLDNQYAYLLEGYHDDWQQVGTQRTATFTNLPPGTFTFRVKAANSEDVWSETSASFGLRILPPWYRTNLAWVVYGLLLFAGVFAADRIQRSRIVRRERQAALERELIQAREIERQHQELTQAHATLKATQAQLIEQEKLASLGQLTAGIAHEIKNPLNFVNNFAEVNSELADELAEAVLAGDAQEAALLVADLKNNATQIAKHGKRADSIVRAMMQHARGGEARFETVDANVFVEEYISLAWHGMRARDDASAVDLARDLEEGLGSVTLMPQELGRVIVNLLMNAFDAVRGVEGPQVTVRSRSDGDFIHITVSDNGPGIPDDIRPRIFEPFFTTKPTGEGTGLGLSLSHDIVAKGHGGSLDVRKSASGGAEFVIRLPKGGPLVATAPPGPPPTGPPPTEASAG